jgi:Tfp pilus assembly pilus retraction ATPase PilT
MLAVVAELSARKRSGYMIALEPANGLGYELAGSFVSERKISGAGEEFAAAIRRATQERPDVLVITPRESSIAAEEAIRAAAPGRLVILGILASTAPRAVESLLSFVSTDREPQLRRLLAGSYRVGFSYRALRRQGGGRTIVEDVLVGTSDVRTRLERADFAGLEKLQRSGADGMRTMDEALARAASRGDISVRQAASHASDRSELIALIRKLARQRRTALRQHAAADRQPGPLRAITMA